MFGSLQTFKIFLAASGHHQSTAVTSVSPGQMQIFRTISFQITAKLQVFFTPSKCDVQGTIGLFSQASFSVKDKLSH